MLKAIKRGGDDLKYSLSGGRRCLITGIFQVFLKKLLATTLSNISIMIRKAKQPDNTTLCYYTVTLLAYDTCNYHLRL